MTEKERNTTKEDASIKATFDAKKAIANLRKANKIDLKAKANHFNSLRSIESTVNKSSLQAEYKYSRS